MTFRGFAAFGTILPGLILATFLPASPQQTANNSDAPQKYAQPYPPGFDPTARFNGKTVNIHPKPIASDPSIKYDYDIAFVRAPRLGDDRQTSWPDVFSPFKIEPGADLMVLHPNGNVELLVKAGPQQAVSDPFVSFDAQWIFYTLFDGIHREPSGQAFATSSDIYKVNVKTRRVAQLTRQVYTPNTGVVKPDYKPSGIFNSAPCPLPGGRVMFTSDRNGFVATKSYKQFAMFRDEYTTAHDFQLFRMDDDGSNVETIGHLNINSALHPTILRDGRVMFTTFESEGMRDTRTWSVWTIHPDGTHWLPLFSNLGAASENARHFMTQLSDGHIIVEQYYFQNNLGFGTYFKMAEHAPEGEAYFGSAWKSDPRNMENPKLGAIVARDPFSPFGGEDIIGFSHFLNAPAYLSEPKDPKSPRAGKVTQPSGAPDNNLLTVYSAGPTYGIAKDSHHSFTGPAIHSGIYMIKGGQAIQEPSQLLEIRFEQDYNLQWPRALVPYKRIYGVDEPARLTPSTYEAHLTKQLPDGSPYGMIGSSSLYKRESYPGGVVPPGKVTAQFEGGDDPFESLGGLGSFGSRNWIAQGAEDGKYENEDIHAIRVVVTVPTTDPRATPEGTRRWWNASNERLRILGEFPVRKFNGDKQPIDPDGNPDTSFLVKLPADIAWTFQMLDKNGMVLNMAQTWHHVRPGEVRSDCGGCHAHSQKPTAWEPTAAAQPDYQVFDLTRATPLVTTKKYDESRKKWDVKDQTGLRFEKVAKNVEYFRDVKPIFERSCVACHTQKWDQPAGHLVLDDNAMTERDTMAGGSITKLKVPGTFARLTMDPTGKLSYPSPTAARSYGGASRYLRFFQSRRSLLAWKIFGQRLDGFSNDDFAYETKPGDPTSLQYRGKPYTPPPPRPFMEPLPAVNLAYIGTSMPPPEAIAGTYAAPDGHSIKVPALSDEDRLTIVRWIDLGCPIDLDYDPAQPGARGHGWLADDNRPTLTLASPVADANTALTRILIGMHDYDSGLDLRSFEVVADFKVDGVKAGMNLAPRFKPTAAGVWELTVAKPVKELAMGQITVSVKDNAGNLSRIERKFSVQPTPVRRAAMRAKPSA